MTDDIAAWLTAIWDEDEARLTGPTFCGPVWPTTDQLLARIAADRQILALHGPEHDDIGSMILGPFCQICRYDEGLDKDPYPCPTIRLLASAHASRPGYSEEWRP